MKNFFKKLSFVLAIAMVLTSVVPATTASAASKVQIELNGKAVTEVTAFFGGVVRNLDASKNGKAASGTWKVGNTKVATVDSKTGVITPVGEGTTKVAFTLKGEKKASASVYVKVRTRAAALHVYDPSEYATGARNKLEDTTIELNVGEDKELKVTMPISKKASNAGAKISTYFLYADSSNEDVVKVSASTKMYTRAVTLKPVAAGEATVTLFANQTTKANARANKYVKEAKFTVKVAGESKIAKAEAKKVNVVEVTFNGAADKDTVLALANKSGAVENTVTWNEDRTVATMKTVAKMTNGTYTVTATVADAKSEASFEVVSQYVKEIQILNDVALTGTYTAPNPDLEKGEVYVYYKVVDQYDDDITASTSINWSTSTDDTKMDASKRSEGKIILRRGDGKAFTYGESVYVTGVYQKTGVMVSKVLTVGTEQALHTVEMKGFVKKNTTELVQALPAGFKENEYYLAFDVLDQNGNVMKADADFLTSANLTLISDNVLVVKDFVTSNTAMKSVVIDGHAYNTMLVVPGMYVNKGGEFNITAIASKTGNKVVKNYVVGQNQILTSFNMESPSGILADGEMWEIPFVALDQNGESITNFVTLANNLNELSFSNSNDQAGSWVALVEQKDGTAKLIYKDGNMSYANGKSTDGFERIVSVTSVVIGGNSDNLMMYISDKARPDAIFDDDLEAAYVEGAEYTFGHYLNASGDEVKTLTFLDQYGRKMIDNSGRLPVRTGYDFFQTTFTTDNGSDFNGYTFDVEIKFNGTNNTAVAGAANDSTTLLGLSNTTVTTGSGVTVTFGGVDIPNASTGNLYTYRIVKNKVGENQQTVSSDLLKTFAVVDVTAVKNFEVADLGTIGITTDASDYATLDAKFGSTSASQINNPATGVSSGIQNKNLYVTVKGKYNGVTVTVPAGYYKIEGDVIASTSQDFGDNLINKVVSAGAIAWGHLYDATKANYSRKNMDSSVKVSIFDRTNTNKLDSITKKILISDSNAYLAVFNAPETWDYAPTDTSFDGADVYNDFTVWNNWWVTLKDQYGNNVTFNPKAEVSYKVSQVVEAAGYAENNFTVSQNDSATLSISGAERGDTFVLTITAKYGGVAITKDVKVTVGADTDAKLYNGNNAYKNTLVKNFLEPQRLTTLQ